MLCWHGQNHNILADKVQQVQELLYLAATACTQLRVPMIIGGDFNFELGFKFARYGLSFTDELAGVERAAILGLDSLFNDNGLVLNVRAAKSREVDSVMCTWQEAVRAAQSNGVPDLQIIASNYEMLLDHFYTRLARRQFPIDFICTLNVAAGTTSLNIGTVIHLCYPSFAKFDHLPLHTSCSITSKTSEWQPLLTPP